MIQENTLKSKFDIFPAIDLLDGRSVRLQRGLRESAQVVHPDPLLQVRQYAESGAKWVHVVNLNAAFGDSPEQHSGARSTEEMILKIIRESGLKVQLGGGIRSIQALESALSLGVERVVVGTWVVTDFVTVMNFVQAAPERFVLGVDSFEGRIAIRGWTQTSEETTTDFSKRLKEAGALRVLYTEVERDGMLTGAAVESSRRLALESGLEVIASGGVSGLNDVRALAGCPGVGGVVVGKALATGCLTLSEALSVQRN
ncbi:MAG: hypothetical protein RI953_914 [Pseudomonadota bacterium]|jgi:phosphoribosylformimino-5-aminoimidazole carboxamide ribotide isomerase